MAVCQNFSGNGCTYPAKHADMLQKNAKPAKIQHFTDHRAFLLAHVQDKKRSNPRWTFGRMAQALGLNSTSSITKVIHGEREPGPKLTSQLIRYFNFNPQEAAYFQDLIRLHKIKQDPRLSALLLEKIQKDHPNSNLRVLDNETFSVISNWYVLTIREMVKLDVFFEDANWISKRFHFKVTPTEATRAIELLLKTELLVRDAQGKLSLNDGRLHTNDDMSSEAIKRYHETMMEHAKAAIRMFPTEEREYQSSSLVLRADRIPEAKQLIRDFHDKFSRLLEEQGGDLLAQLNVQFFPLIKKTKNQPMENNHDQQS